MDAQDKLLEKKMDPSQEKKATKRTAPRSTVEASITCQQYCSSSDIHKSDGVLCNFSRRGIYIETPVQYPPGSVLIVRIHNYPGIPAQIPGECAPRSLCLAQVKWWQELRDTDTIRYGLGLKYID